MTTKLLQEILISVYGDITIIGFEESFSFEGFYFEYYYTSDDRVVRADSINEYELANMAKKWAWNNGYELRSGFEEDWYCDYKRIKDLEFYSDNYLIAPTEPEAIFKTCKMILKETLNQVSV